MRRQITGYTWGQPLAAGHFSAAVSRTLVDTTTKVRPAAGTRPVAYPEGSHGSPVRRTRDMSEALIADAEERQVPTDALLHLGVEYPEPPGR